MAFALSSLRPSRVGVGIATALLAAALAACTANGPSPQTGSLNAVASPEGPRAPVKIGLLVPLSAKGQPGVIGKSLKQAAELALFERDSPNLQLVIKDDKGTPEGAKAAAEEALNSGVTLILGPLFAKSVAAAAPAARKGGVPLIAFSNDRQVAGNGVHLLSFQPAPEVERAIAFAASRGKRRYAALIPNDTFGKTVEPAFRNAIARHGGQIVALENYQGSGNALLEPLRKISAAITAAEAEGTPVDALFIPGGQEHVEGLARLLPQAQIDVQKVKLVGTGGMDYPNAGRDPSLVGAWYPGPDPRGWNDFAQRYAKSYGYAPPRIASLAYDAVNLAVSLSGGQQGAQFTAPMITRPTGFSGVDGNYRLLADGTAERALAILEVQRFGSTIVEAAPATMSPAPAATASGSFSLFNFLNQ